VIREESISPVLAMMSKENIENPLNISDGSNNEVNLMSSTVMQQTIFASTTNTTRRKAPRKLKFVLINNKFFVKKW
jgi:hypothetical protein